MLRRPLIRGGPLVIAAAGLGSTAYCANFDSRVGAEKLFFNSPKSVCSSVDLWVALFRVHSERLTFSLSFPRVTSGTT